MCESCWNVQAFEAKKRTQEICDGEQMIKLSIDELKSNLIQEWARTHETNFQVFKKAVPELNVDQFSFYTRDESDQLHEIRVHLT
jgi:hypothetical protein